MSWQLETAPGLSEKAKTVLTFMSESGSSETISIAEALNDIAMNGEGMESDDFLVGVAGELAAAANAFIERMKGK